MTLDDTPTPDTSLASMNRLQLQAACVKLGLDSTPENELLRRQLREHTGYMQSHAHSSSATMTTTTSITTTTASTTETEHGGVSHLPPGDTDVAMEDAPDAEKSAVKVEQEQEQEEEQEQRQDRAGKTEEKLEAMAVEELSIKQEVMEEDVQETPSFQETTLVEVKTEKEEAEMVIKQEEDASTGSTITIKQEKDEETVTVKQEKVDTKSPSDDIKKEDSPVPIAQRRQMWEARSAAPSQQRSGLPLSKARINNQPTNVATRRANPATNTAALQVQKRRRTTDGEDDMDVKMEEDSSPTPPSGTVKKLIGKFAGSSISAPSSPVGKKRRVDLPTTKGSPGSSSGSVGTSFPSIPKFKRVIKIPVSSTRAGSSLYAMGNNTSRSGSGAGGARRKAASDLASGAADKTPPGSTPTSSAPTTGTTPKKVGSSKPVSAETINRLATPKKINASASAASLSNVTPVPGPNFGASTSSAPTTATVTKARGPVLSTAARAAQRQKK